MIAFDAAAGGEWMDQMWREVEAMTSTQWRVEVSLQDPTCRATDGKLVQWKDNKLVWIYFKATRVS